MTMRERLETERLVLRVHSLEDYEDSVAMWGDPAVTRHIGGRPFTREETWARLLRYVGHWSLLGFGFWIVRERGSDRFVGEVGFLGGVRREMDPPLEAEHEIGWALAPAAQGRGLAFEAVRAAIAWGDARFGGARTTCIIHPDNARSIRLAEKCGYAEVRRTTYKGEPSVVFER